MVRAHISATAVVFCKAVVRARLVMSPWTIEMKVTY
jgi:hypothetical protein